MLTRPAIGDISQTQSSGAEFLVPPISPSPSQTDAKVSRRPSAAFFIFIYNLPSTKMSVYERIIIIFIDITF